MRQDLRLWNPATGRFTSGGTFSDQDYWAAPLPDGRVLLIGDFVSIPNGNGWTAGCHIYDPATQEVSPAAPMLSSNYVLLAVSLHDGRILVFNSVVPLAQGPGLVETYVP